jgi:hypothetical protein
MIEVLLHQLLLQPELHDAVIKHRSRLKWAAAHGHELSWELLDTILMYDEKFGKLPSNKALLEFCATSDDPILARRVGVISPALKDLDDIPKEALVSDSDNLIDGVVKEARREFYLKVFNVAASKVSQGPSAKAGHEHDPYGPDGAMAFLRKMLATDLSESSPELAGIWQDNTETIKQRLADYLAQKQTGLIRLGFERIDKTFLANRGRILVVMGSAGDGKSTFLHSAVYNIARDGHNVLYVTLEFKPSEVWEFLAFIHTHQFKGRLFLPSQNTWASGGAKEADRVNMELVLDDIRQRTSVPGLIDVQQFFTWDEVESYFEVNDPKNHYAAVVVDYLYKMTVPENKYVQEKEAKNTMVSRAITWVHKRNAVLITPHQVNRAGHKSASKDTAEGYTLDDLYMSSALQQDADLVMSVMSSKSNKIMGTMEVGSCKVRKPADDFANHNLHVDLHTGYVQDSDTYRAELTADAQRQIGDMHARQEEKRKAECEVRGQEFKPQDVHGSTETILMIPDVEIL